MENSSLTPGAPGDAEIATLSDAALSGRLLERLAQRDALTAEIRVLAGEWDRRCVWAYDGARSGASWLASNAELSRGAAAAELKVAKRLRSMPMVAEASASGALGADKVAALTRAVDRDGDGSKAALFARDEAMLVEQAGALSVDQTRTAVRYWRHCADDATATEDAAKHHSERFVRLRRTFGGAWDLQGHLGPVEGEMLNNRLSEVMEQIYRAQRATLGEGEQPDTPVQRRADALVELVSRAPRPSARAEGRAGDGGTDDQDTCGTDVHGNTEDRAGGRDEHGRDEHGHGGHGHDEHDHGGDGHEEHGEASPADVHRPLPLLLVEVPLEALEDRSGKPATLPDGTTLPFETLKRLACEAGVASILTRGGRLEVDLGRTTYTPSRAQRRALARRDRQCVFPGCDAPVAFCDAHHLWHWEDGGVTALWNLVLLCRYHHHLVHEGGFRLVAGHDGFLHASRPDDTPIPWPHGQAPHRITPRPAEAPPPPALWPYDRPVRWPDGTGPPPGAAEPDELTQRRRRRAEALHRIDVLVGRQPA